MNLMGVDTGGTFTDFVFRKDGHWGIYKVLSTPSNPATAVLKGLKHMGTGESAQIVHGSTVATNTILERTGTKTALITNKGFEDIIEIGRQNRNRLYDLGFKKDSQMVPTERRFGVRGRILHTGKEFEPLDTARIDNISQALQKSGIESVAVCLLFSFVNPAHERDIGLILERAGLPVYLSHEILPEFREFERTSTTVLNAYVSPKMQGYLRSVIDELETGTHLSIMQSNGGRISPETAMKESVRTILSGPAGGAVGAFETGRKAGFSKIISFDMGGTSTDVCLMDEGLTLTVDAMISGFPLRIPMIDIHTVGAGGGSIVSLDEGGSLRVGPESAGAEPGPICYGKGDRITVTDANLFLGRLLPENFLGGEMALHTDRLETHFNSLSSSVGVSQQELAEGILSIVNAEMEKAVRMISVERGHDPREFTLLAFGGAGGMHAAELAKLLNISRVLIPKNPGILSATGMLMADIVKDYSFTVMKHHMGTEPKDLAALFLPLERKGTGDMFAEGVHGDGLRMERYMDMRYEGQSHEITVPFDGDYIHAFHRLHEKTYGYQNKDKPIEIVNIRLRVRGSSDKPPLGKVKTGTAKPVKEAFMGQRRVVFDGKAARTRIIDREKLLSGNRLEGPAVVVEYSSTIVLPPFATAHVDGYGNMVLEIL